MERKFTTLVSVLGLTVSSIFGARAYAQTSQRPVQATTSVADSVVSPFSRFSNQKVVVKNNLLYDATLTPNITVEAKTSRKTSAQFTAGYNPWTFSDNKKLKHMLFMPELRFWSDSTFYGNFFAINAFYSHYNVSGINLLLWKDTKRFRYQGDAVAVGASFGHRWNFLRRDRQLRRSGFYDSDYYKALTLYEQYSYWRESRWALEAEAGLDVGYTWYEKFDCKHCGAGYGKDSKPFLIPKLGLSIIYRLGDIEHPVAPAVPEQVKPAEVTHAITTVPQFKPVLATVHEFGGVAEKLAYTHPVLKPMSEYRPYDSSRILRKEKGALYVHFPLDKTTLLRDFRGNSVILDQIIEITRLIMADTTSTVKRMQIVGLASIEGKYPHNRDLADGRAMAMQRYVQDQLGLPDSLFDTTGGAEAWSEFRDQINDVRILKTGGTVQVPESGIYSLPSTEGITLDDIDQLFRIIDSSDQPDEKERRIKQMNRGKTYNYLKENILSDQRNSGYIRIFWDHKPDVKAQTINRANQLLQQQQNAEALRLLQTVKDDPRAFNALGVALYLTGSRQQAIDYFRRAAANGDTQAQENLRQAEYREQLLKN